MRWLFGVALCAGACLSAAGPLHAQSEPDTSLIKYLGGLSDSTDRYFGVSAAPVDTSGLDSALAYGLAHPGDFRGRRQLDFTVTPILAFNRVDGPVYGGSVGLGRATRSGSLTGALTYAVGQKEWRGGGHYRKSLTRGPANWQLHLYGGRRTAVVDRERPRQGLAVLRAIVAGSDTRHYMREDGVLITLQRETPVWRARAGYRDMQESAQMTTTTWNFANRTPEPVFNLAATNGRVRELQYQVAARLPFAPFVMQVDHHTSSDALGSDFDYRRTRAALSGEVAMGRHATAVPQLVYGRLSGQAIPQASFYLGGSGSLRSLPGSSLGGTGLALGRLDVIGQDDVLALMRIPHPDVLPIQLGAFAATGAVWGADPYGGPQVSGVDWPNKESYLSEAGIQVLYRPGIPETAGLLRFSYAWPLGPGNRESRWSITYSRPLDLISRFGRE